MTPIALMRHYPTAWNAEQRLQGRTDIPLTEEARETLAGLALPPPWDRARIITSPLGRAAETARLLADGRKVAEDHRLVEMSWGDWEGVRAKDLLADPDSGFRPTHEWDEDTRAPGGESRREAWRRLHPALALIAFDPEPALIVTHKALMRLMLGTAHGWQGVPEIKRGRVYPMRLAPCGRPCNPEEPVRLVAR